MSFPDPQPAQVIRYSYLWHSEYARGQEEGAKDRPCAVVLLVTNDAGEDVATVLPITHTPPSSVEMHLAVEIPQVTKQRLGLDSERSWVMLTEANRFVWPGPDLRMTRNGDPSSVVYGMLPEKLFEHIRRQFLANLKIRRSHLIARTE